MENENTSGLTKEEEEALVGRYMRAAEALALERVNQITRSDRSLRKFRAELTEVESMAEPYLEQGVYFQNGVSHGIQQANRLHQKAVHSNYVCLGIIGLSATAITNLFPIYQSHAARAAIWEPFALIYLMCGLLALWGALGLFLSRKS